jgi:hypothetical protein
MGANEVDVDPQVLGSLEERKISRREFLASEHRLSGNPSIGISENATIGKGPLKASS